jgi:hypothetical protein
MRGRGLKQQLRDNERINHSNTRRQLRLKIQRTSEEFDREAFGLEFIKRPNRTFGGSLKIRNWTLWGVDRLQDEKKAAVRAGAVNVEAPTPSDTERKKAKQKQQRLTN